MFNPSTSPIYFTLHLYIYISAIILSLFISIFTTLEQFSIVFTRSNTIALINLHVVWLASNPLYSCSQSIILKMKVWPYQWLLWNISKCKSDPFKSFLLIWENALQMSQDLYSIYGACLATYGMQLWPLILLDLAKEASVFLSRTLILAQHHKSYCCSYFILI